MKYCWIFGILSLVCFPIKETLGCSGAPACNDDSRECICSKHPEHPECDDIFCSKHPEHPECNDRQFGWDFQKMKLTANVENPTPDCTEGGRCFEQAHCGKYGECIIPSNQLVPSRIG